MYPFTYRMNVQEGLPYSVMLGMYHAENEIHALLRAGGCKTQGYLSGRVDAERQLTDAETTAAKAIMVMHKLAGDFAREL